MISTFAIIILIISILFILVIAKRLNMKRKHDDSKWNDLKKIRSLRPLNVVITGGSKGIGFALAKKFLEMGDCVVICSRSNVDFAVEKLKKLTAKESINGTSCDVGNSQDVKNLVHFASQFFSSNNSLKPNSSTPVENGVIDLWINNAGTDGGMHCKLIDIADEKVESVINTNLTGLIYCCKTAIQQMLKQRSPLLPSDKSQKGYGHIYNMEGYGSRGEISVDYSIYGCTKYALTQLSQTLSAECDGTGIGIHRVSPGMVITDLLVGAHKIDTIPLKSKNIFNILAEEAPIVADCLVPRLRDSNGTNKRIAFLTPFGALFRFATFFMRRNRFFDQNGELIYKY